MLPAHPSKSLFFFCQDVVLDLINQTRDLRSELNHKEQTIAHLSGDISDITVLKTLLYFTFHVYNYVRVLL